LNIILMAKGLRSWGFLTLAIKNIPITKNSL
jgi:hypothetical protein